MRSEAGLSTMELLFSLLVTALFLSALVLTLHRGVAHYTKIKGLYNENYTLLRTEALLRKIMRDLDAHPFLLPPRIQAGSALQFTNGKSNPILKLNGTRAPALNSDAISSLTLDTHVAHIVTHVRPSGAALSFSACPRYGHALKKEHYKSYLGLHPEGFIELTGTVHALPATPEKLHCKKLILKGTTSMSTSSDYLERARNVEIIIPIRDHYTLYVDQTHQLRYLAHSGANNIENQPILKNIKSLAFTLRTAFTNSITLLSGELETTSGKKYQFSIPNKLARRSHYNFLLQRP